MDVTLGSIGMLVLGACSTHVGPTLTAATPSAASAGETVTLTGEHMCGASGDCSTAGGDIQIGLALPATLAQIEMYSDTSAQIEIPSLAPVGDTELVLIVDDQSSNALSFTVLAQP